MINQQQQNNYQIKENNNSAQQGLDVANEAGRCRHCGHATFAGGDICENCGAWQLDGQCCFCYHAVKVGQKFCGECGNPPQGIDCPQCGTHSIFDFCPKCNSPVSNTAGTYYNQLKNSPELTDIFKQARELETQQQNEIIQPQKAQGTPQQDWLTQLQNYEQHATESVNNKEAKTPAPSVKSNGLFQFGNTNKDISSQLDATEQSADIKASQLNFDAQKQALIKNVAALQNKTFSSNQEARKFYTSLKIMIPEVVKIHIPGVSGGWTCNYCGNTHSSPSGCARPELGGSWGGGIAAQDITKIQYKEL